MFFRIKEKKKTYLTMKKYKFWYFQEYLLVDFSRLF